MYDNSINKMPQPSAQPQHIEFAYEMASNISGMPLDQQNEVLIHIFNIVKERRKNETLELTHRSNEFNDRINTIKHADDTLRKSMESLQVSAA